MATQQQQQQPPHSNYTKIDDGDDLPNAAESAEVRNPLAPPSTPEQLRHEQLRQPLAAPEDEADGSKFRAVVAVVRCMVGPAALYIPRGFRDAGIGGSCLCFASSSPRSSVTVSISSSWRNICHSKNNARDSKYRTGTRIMFIFG